MGINLPMFTQPRHSPGFLLELVGVGSHMSLALSFCCVQIKWGQVWHCGGRSLGPHGKNGIALSFG